MSELGTKKYYTPQFQGNLINAANPLTDPQYDNARRYAQQNTLGKVVGDLSEAEKKNSLSPLYTLLYGFITALGVDSLSKWFVKDNRFEHFLGKVDNNRIIKNVGNWFENAWTGMKDTAIVRPFKNIANHFAKHAGDVRPVKNFAIGASRTMGGELTEELIDHSTKQVSEMASAPLKELLEKYKQGTIKADKVPKEISTILKKVGIETDDISKILKSKRSAKKLIKSATELITEKVGTKESAPFKVLMERYKHGKLKWNEAYEELFKTFEKAGIKGKKLENIIKDDVFKLNENRIHAVTGFVRDKSGKLVKSLAGETFASKALRKIFSGEMRFFRLGSGLNIIATSYFVGDAVKNTIDAPWGDKTSTFMESMFGNVVPFWMLMNAITRIPYQLAGGLKTFGKGSALGKIFGAPLRGIGHLLGMGAAKAELTAKMTKETAEKLLGEKAAKKYMKLAEKIAKGEGTKAAEKSMKKLFKELGISASKAKLTAKMTKEAAEKFFREQSTKKYMKFADQITSGEGAKAAKKSMQKLFKESVPLLKRVGIKLKNLIGGTGRALVVMMVLMPLVSGLLKKISYKIFGKPQATIDEEKKEAAEQAKTEAESNKPQNIPQNSSDYQKITDTKSPLVAKYLQKINSANPYIPSNQSLIANTAPSYRNRKVPASPLVAKYLKPHQNPASYNIRNQSIPDRTKNTSVAASVLGVQKDYSSVPDPIGINPQTAAQVNIALKNVDRTLRNAEKTLQGN